MSAMIDHYRLSIHTKEQLTRRHIEVFYIEEVLKHPDFVHIDSECVHVYQKLMHEGESKYLLRIFLNICKTPALVITVYKTSKLSKYEDNLR